MRKFIDHARAMFRRLRCRPGDICWLKQDLRADGPFGGGQVLVPGGTIVTVTTIVERDIWLLAETIHGRFQIGPFGFGFTVLGLADDILIPLRDRPGSDQSLRWKPRRFSLGDIVPAKQPVPLIPDFEVER